MPKLSVVTPPTIFELIEDPVYKSYLANRPRLHPNLKWGNPWQVVALRRKHKKKPPWVVAMRPDYTAAIQTFKDLRNTGKFKDISIISRRKLFGPPHDFDWDDHFVWCARCRRPSLFRLHTADTHHGLRGLPLGISLAGRHRCFYCGAAKDYMDQFRKEWDRS